MRTSTSKILGLKFVALVLTFHLPLKSRADDLTAEQRSACAEVPSMAYSQCVQRYTQINVVDAAAKRRDENLNPAPAPTPTPRQAISAEPPRALPSAARTALLTPDTSCNFEGYVAECTHAVDAAVLVFKQSFAGVSEGEKRLSLMRATGTCKQGCSEQISRLQADRGCFTRANGSHQAQREAELSRILEKCATPENVGAPASNASEDLNGRRALAEGQTPAHATQTMTTVATETCVPQSTGVAFCRATGIGTTTPAFYYRDATGAVYNTHEAATITRRSLPMARAGREVVEGEEFNSPADPTSDIRPEARSRETFYQLPTGPHASPQPSPARESLYSSTGAIIPQPVAEAPDYDAQIPASARATTPQPAIQPPSEQVTALAAPSTTQNSYLRNQPYTRSQQYSPQFELERNGYVPASSPVPTSLVNFGGIL